MGFSRKQVSVCLLFTGIFSTAHAAQVAPEARSESALDTVTVTGVRMRDLLDVSTSVGAMGSKSVLDTPFSVTAVDEEDIARRQVNSVAQLFFNDPSIFSAAPAATTAWWAAQIRGIGVRNFYVDGVPFMMSWGGEFPLEPVERVDALKGLTGFMHGFGAPGGAFNYQIKKPSPQPLAMTSLEIRNDGLVSVQIDAGGRAGEAQGLGYRMNVAGEFGEAYNGSDVDRGVASLALDYRFNADLDWFATAVYEDNKLQNEPLHFYRDTYQGGQPPRPTHDYENLIVRDSFYDYETLIGSTGLHWRMSEDWKSTVTLGYSLQDHRSHRAFANLLNAAGDYDGLIYDFAQRMEFYIGQALFEGAVSTGSIRHELVFGTSYERELTQPSSVYSFTNDFSGNIYEQQTYAAGPADPGLAPFKREDRQAAVFASDTMHFADRWQALIGYRHTDYEVVDRDRNPAADSSYQTDALSPTYALIFKPIQPVSLYGSYVESMEKGLRVGSTYANAGELLDATISRQYEIGAKLDLPRFSFTTAAFRVEQVARIDQIRDGLRYLSLDGLTVYDGIEANGNLRVTPNLVIGLGGTYLDASIDRVSPQNAGLLGNVPAGVSDWQAVAHVDYRVARIAGLSLFGNVRYIGDAYYANQNEAEIPHRTLTNVGLEYRTELAGRRTVFAAAINNLFDKAYWELNSLGENRNGALSMRVYW